MNKKGQIELADLGGFVLIFIISIVLGVIFVNLNPKAHIEVLDTEYGNYLAKYVLLDFLGHEENGRNTADEIVLAVKTNNFDNLDKITHKILDAGTGYILTVSNDGGVVYYNNTNIQSQEHLTREVIIIPKPELKYDIFNINLANYYDEKIRVKLYLLKGAEVE